MSLLKPAEAQSLAGLNRETLRYWRKQLRPLYFKHGNQQCFTLGDVLALRILNRMVANHGCDIRIFSKLATTLFDQLNGPEWPRLEHRRLLVCPAKKTVHLLPTSQPIEQTFEEVTFVIDLAGDVLALRNARLGISSSSVRKTQLPLFAERKRRSSRMPLKSS